MDLSAIKPFLADLGVQPAWYPAMVALGIINQFGKGMVSWWGPSISFAVAVLAGAGMTVDNLFADRSDLGPAALRGIVMAAAVLLTEGLMDQAANKFDFIPKNNAWVKTPATPPSPPKEGS